MTVEYDPFSHEAMTDPTALYKQLREESPVYYMEKYDAWAFAGFEEIWKAGLDMKSFTATTGVSPAQILLKEPAPPSFMTMDLPGHKLYRNIIAEHYTPEAVDEEKARIRELVREILAPLLERGEFEVYSEYANRVTTLNASYMAGVPKSDGEWVRATIDDMLARDEKQVGTSARNGEAAMKMDGYFRKLVGEIREGKTQAQGHLEEWFDSRIDGQEFTDDDFVSNLFSMMVTGSETTPLVVSGTLNYLHERPDQRAQIKADRSLLDGAFKETIRFDQPTNMLGRRLVRDVEYGGQQLKEGQGVMFLWASANRDEREFPDADRFDIHRRPKRTLSFGRGLHRCLGEWMGLALGNTILEEFLNAVDYEYEIDEGNRGRVYGEFLCGYNRMPVKFEPTSL